jgi:hypothetical protein
MKVRALGWVGVRTQNLGKMNAFCRDVLNPDVLSLDEVSGRFRSSNGTEVHVYGPGRDVAPARPGLFTFR